MNWDDPAARLALIDRVGHEEYNRLIREHIDSTVVETVNGYPLRPINTRFGRAFHVMGTTVGFSTLEQARTHANSLPTRKADHE